MRTSKRALYELAGLEEKSLRKRNRAATRIPRSHRRFWCAKCDANLVHEEERCGVCGFCHLLDSGVLARREIA